MINLSTLYVVGTPVMILPNGPAPSNKKLVVLAEKIKPLIRDLIDHANMVSVETVAYQCVSLLCIVVYILKLDWKIVKYVFHQNNFETNVIWDFFFFQRLNLLQVLKHITCFSLAHLSKGSSELFQSLFVCCPLSS